MHEEVFVRVGLVTLCFSGRFDTAIPRPPERLCSTSARCGPEYTSEHTWATARFRGMRLVRINALAPNDRRVNRSGATRAGRPSSDQQKALDIRIVHR
jgi:hypothetical protein